MDGGRELDGRMDEEGNRERDQVLRGGVREGWEREHKSVWGASLGLLAGDLELGRLPRVIGDDFS